MAHFLKVCHPELFEPKVKLHLVVNYGQLRQGNPRQAKKKSGTPTATTVPEMRQKKTTQKLLYIIRLYSIPAWRRNNMDKYNLIMYNSRTRSTLLPRSAARRASRFPTTPVVQRIKNISLFVCPCTCSIWFPFSLHSVPGAAFVPHAAPDTPFHFHFNHTLQHPPASENTHFHFANFIHSVFPQALFPLISNGIFFISA